MHWLSLDAVPAISLGGEVQSALQQSNVRHPLETTVIRLRPVFSGVPTMTKRPAPANPPGPDPDGAIAMAELALTRAKPPHPQTKALARQIKASQMAGNARCAADITSGMALQAADGLWPPQSSQLLSKPLICSCRLHWTSIFCFISPALLQIVFMTRSERPATSPNLLGNSHHHLTLHLVEAASY